MTEKAMIEGVEMAEAMGITLEEYAKIRRSVTRHNPYNEDPQPITCPYHGECDNCYADCDERS